MLFWDKEEKFYRSQGAPPPAHQPIHFVPLNRLAQPKNSPHVALETKPFLLSITI